MKCMGIFLSSMGEHNKNYEYNYLAIIKNNLPYKDRTPHPVNGNRVRNGHNKVASTTFLSISV